MAGMGMGFEGMLDTVEFVRKTWGQLNLPTAFAPTMDLGEIDKRITDLKAVEQWLVVNLSMLRTTIQAVEMQRSAIATMQAFGQAMTAPAQASTSTPAAATGRSQPEPSREPASAPTWPQMFAGTVASDLRDPMDSGGLFAPPVPPSAVRPEAGASAPPPEGPPGPMLDPTAWWNLLQQQFTQVAGQALAGAGFGALAAGAMGPAASAMASASPADEAERGRQAHEAARASPPGDRGASTRGSAGRAASDGDSAQPASDPRGQGGKDRSARGERGTGPARSTRRTPPK